MQTGPEITVEDLRIQVEEGRQIQELMATPGWAIFEQEINRKIAEMRSISEYPDNLRKIQASYQASNALKDVLGFFYAMISAKENAEQLLERIPRTQ